MNLFLENHQRLIKALQDAKVDFIIIGGYSVIFHGYTRTTGDMDVWLKPDNENKSRLLEALAVFGIDYDSIERLRVLDFSNVLAFHIDEEPQRVDFLTKVNMVSFEEADRDKIIADLDGTEIPFLHLRHLILSKLNTGRAKDRADVEELQKIQQTIKGKKL